jgi:soluble P-type ATPase
MQKTDYLYEDKVNSKSRWICLSFFSKHYVKKVIENNKETAKEIEDKSYALSFEDEEDYSTEDDVLALKVRGGGTFETYEQACNYAAQQRNVDPNHHIYVQEVGKWCAFKIKDDNKYIEQTEHANEELNSMMKKYDENQEKAKIYHEFRKNVMVAEGLNDSITNKQNSLNETLELLDQIKLISHKEELLKEFDDLINQTDDENTKEQLVLKQNVLQEEIAKLYELQKDKDKLRQKRNTLDEQITKLQERKNDLDKTCKDFEEKLKLIK